MKTRRKWYNSWANCDSVCVTLNDVSFTCRSSGHDEYQRDGSVDIVWRMSSGDAHQVGQCRLYIDESRDNGVEFGITSYWSVRLRTSRLLNQGLTGVGRTFIRLFYSICFEQHERQLGELFTCWSIGFSLVIFCIRVSSVFFLVSGYVDYFGV